MTEAKVITLTAALRSAGVEHRVYDQNPGTGDWRVQATSTSLYTTAQLQNLETTHGVVAETNRAQFR
jgi:hypothetical protein